MQKFCEESRRSHTQKTSEIAPFSIRKPSKKSSHCASECLQELNDSKQWIIMVGRGVFRVHITYYITCVSGRYFRQRPKLVVCFSKADIILYRRFRISFQNMFPINWDMFFEGNCHSAHREESLLLLVELDKQFHLMSQQCPLIVIGHECFQCKMH